MLNKPFLFFYLLLLLACGTPQTKIIEAKPITQKAEAIVKEIRNLQQEKLVKILPIKLNELESELVVMQKQYDKCILEVNKNSDLVIELRAKNKLYLHFSLFFSFLIAFLMILLVFF
jgi:hypothetical protein